MLKHACCEICRVEMSASFCPPPTFSLPNAAYHNAPHGELRAASKASSSVPDLPSIPSEMVEQEHCFKCHISNQHMSYRLACSGTSFKGFLSFRTVLGFERLGAREE